MFFADVVIEYVLRLLYQLVAAAFTMTWGYADARLVRATAREGGGVMGCALTRLHYKYRVGDKENSGKGWHAFLTASSEEDSRKYYPPGCKFRVRVSNSNPARSFYCLLDQ